MRKADAAARILTAVLLFAMPFPLVAQGTAADYERARNLRSEMQGLAYNNPERSNWIEKTHRFWYRKTVKGGHEFVLVNAGELSKQPAFDHDRLADALSKAAGESYTGLALPFNSINFVENETALEFQVSETRWQCLLSSYSCRSLGPAERRRTEGGPPLGPMGQAAPLFKASPDGKYEAFIRNYNIFLRVKGSKEELPLSYDGSEGEYYSLPSLQWSPDSGRIAAFRTRTGYKRLVHFIESSPADQLQPKHSTREYAKPGDVIDVNMPALFDLAGRRQIPIDNRLFASPYSNQQIRWWKDSRAFTFEHNQRGHKVFRVIEVDAWTGGVRAIVSEESPTFFNYSGKRYRFDLGDGKEMLWMSERDGWNHLYLYEGATGTVKNQITKGSWVVRGVDKIDEENRLIFFRASGMYPGKDPYFVHYYRINFDGTGLTALTDADANHTVSHSDDMQYYVNTYSRVDLPTVSELRRTSDRKVVMELERAEIQDLVKAGWRAPEVFVAKGRDGVTDIWGVIIRPHNFNPSQKYAVIENIYAGPQDSFVPKSFAPYLSMQSLAELGFIVVQVDGMGTSNRSKAFHDVCWQNLGDAGFPDRKLWHEAIAAKHPYYDISRVGIYGNSAGGQNSLGALLFHPEFYRVAVSSCGCHDNRMDKIWWNEQWMGYPIGPHYAASSNVDNAHRLQGKLLLIVGEMDTNVDPASTMQVVNALIKAKKYFDLLVIPGGGHGIGGEYGELKRSDFFVRHLLNVEPPDWNSPRATQ